MAVPKGRVVFEGPVSSALLGGSRFVRVYLPPSYPSRDEARFPVLYVQDGQNAFTTVGDYVAFGWGNWRLDRTVDELSAAKRMREIILVAIDCGAHRYLEYRGPASGSGKKPPRKGSSPDSRFEAYARFLVEELKPHVDAQYRTLPGPESTGLLGSSMGGVCSLALAWKYPGTFGLAASLSGSFQVERGNFRMHTLDQRRGRSGLRFYLDSGIIDTDGSDDGYKHTAAVVRKLQRLGWRSGVDLMSYADKHLLTNEELADAGVDPAKWKEAQSSQHNELYWRLRAWRPLAFLFPPSLAAGE